VSTAAASRLGWYVRGAVLMSTAELAERLRDAGITLLRTSVENEIWCRCHGGQHGYGSIAAHAYADAQSVEVRVFPASHIMDHIRRPVGYGAGHQAEAR
jgi:hypothetical protein